MSSATINKTKDTLNYLAHRAESKISEAGYSIHLYLGKRSYKEPMFIAKRSRKSKTWALHSGTKMDPPYLQAPE